MMNKIKINRNGVDSDANIVKFLELDDNDYILYKFNGEDDVYASKIVKNNDEIDLYPLEKDDLDRINDSNLNTLYLKEAHNE